MLCLVLVAGGCSAAPARPPVFAGGTPSVSASADTPAVVPAPATSAAPQPSRRPGKGPLSGKVIVLDPGHNGDASHPEILNQLVDAYTKLKPCNTTGTQTPAGYPEHAFNWDLANRLAALLRAAGATVLLTRPSDTGIGPCITERAAIGNRNKAAAVVSIHADGHPDGGPGFHVMEPALIAGAPSVPIVPASHRLAVAVRDRLRAIQPPAGYIGTDGLNVRDDMGGLNLSRVPVVMVECGNMKDPADAIKLSTPAFRQRLAAALATGLSTYLGTH
jgi:N-acetylmuramoyl-L-alanine amidase